MPTLTQVGLESAVIIPRPAQPSGMGWDVCDQLTSAQTMSHSGGPACRLATLIVNRDPWTTDWRVFRKDHHSNRLFPFETYLGAHSLASCQPSYI